MVSVPVLIFSGVALAVQDKYHVTENKVKKYETSAATEIAENDYHSAKQKLNNYSVLKVHGKCWYKRNIAFYIFIFYSK